MATKIRVGVFFGGQAREREISYLGGKTAFEHIDKALFEPIPIFVDSLGHFIQINPELLYEESIRDFFPSKNLNRGFRVYIESLGELNETQLYKLIYKVGKQIHPADFPEIMDFAFTIMHGPQAEDGSLQGLLEWYGIPYMGPGLMGSAVGINKPMQNKLIALVTGQQKKTITFTREEWASADRSKLFTDLINSIGFPFVVKAPHQGSSIGVAIVRKRSLEEFTKAVNQCFFEAIFKKSDWEKLTERQKRHIMEKTSNLDEGIGFPVMVNGKILAHPADLMEELDAVLFTADTATVVSVHAEDYVMIEEFVHGQEFSCGVIQHDDGKAIALPPTEIYGEIQTFDFKSKYKSNVTKKRIPVETSMENLHKIHESLLKTFNTLGFCVVTRIDGFLTPDGRVLLHDPNTIPGMSPSSLIFKQMAEIGLTVTQSITYFIRQSIRERIRSGKNTVSLRQLLDKLDGMIEERGTSHRKKVAVIFGESDELYKRAQKKIGEFSASPVYEPVPVCAAKNGQMYKIPMNLMFKADIMDFGQSIGKPKHPFIAEIIDKAKDITAKYAGSFDTQMKKLSEAELAETVQFIYQCDAETLVEL
ncbi:D-alanine--D-alanine ligase [Emticicia sp. TH156]|uniref:D-alanine--D-alanine ligase family protein n=1 Tax=Emticicia sp. TH156 TaxID=2067454 RepID=UPI000C768084|nr:D-alanine--D-alanine ligase [Emticicia sp. TH156]PLK44294.1 D-alanine--D-alanine ligase [Emticicia sp. TH156]